MHSRHVTHLVIRYVHGQLRPAQRAQVINHVRGCPDCRARLAREERVAADLRREMPLIGQACGVQLAHVWAGVWHEIGSPRPRSRPGGTFWLPGLSAALAVLLLAALALPLLAQSGLRAEAAPFQARPINTGSPTPGVTGEATADRHAAALAGAGMPQPQATIAYAMEVGASPVPVPVSTASPAALSGAAYRR
jgi:hypothetical protein